MAQKPATRTWIIEEHDELPGYDRAEALGLLQDLEAVLFRVGGVVHIAADRVKIGSAGSEDIFESAGLVIQWKAFSPGREPDHPEVEDDELAEVA